MSRTFNGSSFLSYDWKNGHARDEILQPNVSVSHRRGRSLRCPTSGGSFQSQRGHDAKSSPGSKQKYARHLRYSLSLYHFLYQKWTICYTIPPSSNSFFTGIAPRESGMHVNPFGPYQFYNLVRSSWAWQINATATKLTACEVQGFPSEKKEPYCIVDQGAKNKQQTCHVRLYWKANITITLREIKLAQSFHTLNTLTTHVFSTIDKQRKLTLTSETERQQTHIMSIYVYWPINQTKW